jgi:glycosyltransferase involved in cell wall biosynthesis
MDLRRYTPEYKKLDVINFDYKFTIFTPMYNRADTIDRVFKSLNNLVFRDFELILINDGSTDNSHETALQLIESATFQVHYLNNTKNKHKMACFFEAIDIAKGEFFLTLDSDDECLPNALDILLNEYQSIPEDLKNHISGVTGLCKDQTGKLFGKEFPTVPYYSSSFDKSIELPNSGEKWGFTKTAILKGITVNTDIFSKGLIPESYVWNLISKQGYKTKYINKILRIYYLDTGNRLSNVNYQKDSFGTAIYSISVLNWFHKSHFPKKANVFLKRLYTLLRASKYLEFKRDAYLSAIENYVFKALFFIGWHFRKLIK